MLRQYTLKDRVLQQYALKDRVLQQYALKGQKLLAQGSALGKHVINKVAL